MTMAQVPAVFILVQAGWLVTGITTGISEGWQALAQGAPEQLWLPLDPWQCPRPGWTLGLGAAWDSGRCPCPWQGLQLDDLKSPFQSRLFL